MVSIETIMASDAHAHPYDLTQLFSACEEERQKLGIICAASAWNLTEFLFHEELAKTAHATNSKELVPGFGIHPQLFATNPEMVQVSQETLVQLLEQHRINFIGETGFDLFKPEYRNTEHEQDRSFSLQLILAKEYTLPLVLHNRKATHKIFLYSHQLATVPAVVFHSYAGTYREAEDILKRGINAYFSFGNTILLNHKKAMECCALLSAERLLFETDAPYQPLRGKSYSSWRDLPVIMQKAAELRKDAGTPVSSYKELEIVTDINFENIFYF